ncbi:SUMO-interacting motif-containing protein 1 [Periophthalmus magnuspinnatus]|uniref:SUMO-interacting motif-containing protein 1 n=1 Tax=Periophthalmus magnuspinnatus TaxID=409849 RepID=UPI00145A24A5|nr:SUMO-interacting motif-containing protein 1 [Periophthalmus magnuspinnatus]
MAVVITLSSDSDGDSEVEIVGSYSNKNDMLPLSTVRVHIDDVNTPLSNTDLTNPRSPPAELNIFSSLVSLPPAVVDLTEYNRCEDDELNLPTDDTYKPFFTTDFPGDSRISVESTEVCAERRLLRPQKTQLMNRPSCHPSILTSSVILKRLSILENNLALLTSEPVYVVKTGETMALHCKQCDRNIQTDCTDLSKTKTPHSLQPTMETRQSNSCQGQVTGSHQTPSLAQCSRTDHFHQEHQISQLTQNTDEHSSIPSPACASSPSIPFGTLTVQTAFTQSRHSSTSDDVHCISKSDCPNMTELLKPLHDEMLLDNLSISRSPAPKSVPSISRSIDLDKESFPYEDDFGVDSPVSFGWEESREDEQDMDCTQSDKYYVCPAAVKRFVYGRVDVPTEEERRTKSPQILGTLSLSLVYSTMQESYPEGTLQLLSDLLQPGYYPPKDITLHLLKEILLNPRSPHHHCVQAFSLLMKTQRHHIADKWSISWDWEMLSNAMENKELCPRSMRMFLDYVVLTLEDDFKTKQSTSALYQSIAKAMLSFDQQFPHIKDICKWLFSAIMYSTDCKDIHGDHTRMVVLFQKMLSLALEVDCSPAICSAKLSQELFHMLISTVALRPHRMLLLESLQSKRLRCKLLEHVLDYSCPVKTSVPMSLSLLLHFLKNCTLSPDPGDGTEKWRRWEELINHLWMLLLSYSNAMKGYLGGSKMEQSDSIGTRIYKPEDMVSKCAVREAVEAFLCRSQDDVGEALPLHVVESLSYLQDHLMDGCQC